MPYDPILTPPYHEPTWVNLPIPKSNVIGQRLGDLVAGMIPKTVESRIVSFNVK
jgi:hypothetical protein